MRRGKPTVHKAFDEATAILAGDSLHALAFEILADHETHEDPFVRAALVLDLARAAGPAGMAGGQMMDLAAEGQALDLPAVTRLQQLKTGALIEFAVEAACIMARLPAEARTPYRGYARNIGLAFQIADDLIDHSGDAAGGRQARRQGCRVGQGDHRLAARPGPRPPARPTCWSSRRSSICQPWLGSRAAARHRRLRHGARPVSRRPHVGVYPGTFDPVTLGPCRHHPPRRPPRRPAGGRGDDQSVEGADVHRRRAARHGPPRSRRPWPQHRRRRVRFPAHGLRRIAGRRR